MRIGMSQIHLHIGDNTYELSRERSRWAQEFALKHSVENCARFMSKDISLLALADEVAVMPFIAQKRLVIVEGVPKGKKEDIERLEQIIHPDVILLFSVEAEIGKKAKDTAVIKALRACCSVKECPSLTGPSLQSWASSLLAANSASISAEGWKLLLDITGEDQSLLATELAKMTLYASGREITADDVSLLTACSTEREVWHLFDLLGAGRSDEALTYVHSLLDRGLSVQSLWTTFLWMMSALVTVKAYVADGETNPWNIARAARMHGGSVKALIPLVKRIDERWLQEFIDCLVLFDRGLKTGSYKATLEAPQEMMAMIDRSVLAFSEIP